MVAALASGAAAIGFEASALPDSIFVTGTREVCIESKPYIELRVPEDEAANASVSVDSSYTVTAMLYGMLPIKSIEVTRIRPEYVELSGQPVGILLYSDGLVVAGLSSVETAQGMVNPGEQCGLVPGDVIRAIDGEKPESTQAMLEKVEQSRGKLLIIEVQRSGGEVEELHLQPVYSLSESTWRAGIWIKESSSGLGMLTFVSADGEFFGGLGHAICDGDTGSTVRIQGGDLMNAHLTGVTPGARGMPGELIGTLGDQRLGTVAINCESGVYGNYLAECKETRIARVAMKQELREGPAQILTTLPGSDKPELYDVIIEQINYDADAPTRNLIIRVDDRRVLSVTGGIVQGMSGSPIIQDGAFVAALTHVFVNDPTMGYGIFAENMLEFADNEQRSTEGAA